MELTINIQAEGLVRAIETLAAALSNKKETEFERITNQGVEALFQQQSAAAVAPIQQPVPTAVPTMPMTQPTQQLQQAPVQQAPVQQQPTPVPTSTPTYTMDKLAVAATQLMDAGKRNELLQLLSAFGVQALTQLPQEQYGAFATKLREMGANL
jgi:hypothetical protein